MTVQKVVDPYLYYLALVLIGWTFLSGAVYLIRYSYDRVINKSASSTYDGSRPIHNYFLLIGIANLMIGAVSYWIMDTTVFRTGLTLFLILSTGTTELLVRKWWFARQSVDGENLKKSSVEIHARRTHGEWFDHEITV